MGMMSSPLLDFQRHSEGSDGPGGQAATGLRPDCWVAGPMWPHAPSGPMWLTSHEPTREGKERTKHNLQHSGSRNRVVGGCTIYQDGEVQVRGATSGVQVGVLQRQGKP